MDPKRLCAPQDVRRNLGAKVSVKSVRLKVEHSIGPQETERLLREQIPAW